VPPIDERVVSMVFENAKFEAGVAQTMATLGKLDVSLQKIGQQNSLGDIEKAANKVTLSGPMSALDKLKSRLFGSGQGAAEGMAQIEQAGNKVTLEQPIKALNKVQTETAQVGRGAADGFNEIEKAAGRTSLQGLTSALDSVTAKFSVLQGAASVALGNITAQATAKGAGFGKSFALGPVTQGFDEYKTNLSSIQTIMANTEGQQVSGLDATNKHLEELNKYSDQTIYNFSQMAKNIGTFTAAGVDLPRATSSIKGIANLAALSGSSSQQASTAMYQLSQAIASGRVSLQDWNSVVNAGMGGAKFQKALMQTASTFGDLDKGAVKIDKATGKATVNGESFRESIMAKPGQKSWLSEKVLVETLKQFTGDLSSAELAAQGFNEEQIKSIMATAKSAKAAATEVKTLPQVFDVAREAIGSGWSKTFQLIFGDFNESKKLFTGVSNSLNKWIGKVSDARNKMFSDWKAAGGRTQLLEGLKQAFQNILAILKPIKAAFRDIFPATTGGQLASMTRQFLGFMQKLKPSEATVENLRRTFRGFFAVLHIGWSIVKSALLQISSEWRARVLADFWASPARSAICLWLSIPLSPRAGCSPASSTESRRYSRCRFSFSPAFRPLYSECSAGSTRAVPRRSRKGSMVSRRLSVRFSRHWRRSGTIGQASRTCSETPRILLGLGSRRSSRVSPASEMFWPTRLRGPTSTNS
jgi:tape measure domain-containing protein